MSHLCGVYPGICLTTEEKARKNLSQGSRKVPSGTWKQNIQNRTYITIRIHKHNNKNYINQTVQKHSKYKDTHYQNTHKPKRWKKNIQTQERKYVGKLEKIAQWVTSMNILLTRHYSVYQIEAEEMGRACSMYRWKRNTWTVYWKAWRKQTFCNTLEQMGR